MKDENISTEITTIQFFIESSKYHYNNLNSELSEGNLPEIDEEVFKKLIGTSKGLEIGFPVTFYYNEGYATELYEFYSFISSVMSSVNNIIDLKCRIIDGYSLDYSISFGKYLRKSSKYKESTAHRLIINNSSWIEEVREIRNIIHHKPIQNFIAAHLVFKGENDKEGNIIDKSYVKKYVPIKNEMKEILEFCDYILNNLEIFWENIKKELTH